MGGICEGKGRDMVGSEGKGKERGDERMGGRERGLIEEGLWRCVQ